MKKILLLIILIPAIGFISPVLSQNYSIRANLLNLVAKGPSVTLAKDLKEHSEILLTYSSGRFIPFYTEDYYKYSTIYAEYRRKDCIVFKDLRFYYGPYLRYIKKRIITQEYEIISFGLLSKESRNFIGNGLSTGLSNGLELSIGSRWLIDFNTLLGAGKYISQVDYAGHDAISVFFDTRLALQVGFRF